MKCLRCGKAIKERTCEFCGFDVHSKGICSIFPIGDLKLFRDMDIFYQISGRIYTYDKAKQLHRFQPRRGDQMLVRYLNPDGTMSKDEPDKEAIAAYRNNMTSKEDEMEFLAQKMGKWISMRAPGIIAISSHGICTMGLRSDGTVVATGANKYGQCDTYTKLIRKLLH